MQRVPSGPDDLDAAWLDEWLAPARVSSFAAEPIGEDGFVSELSRLTLDYEGSAPVGPPTLVAKFSHADPDQRRLLHGIGMYEREVRFYRDLAGRSPLRTPRCHHAAVDAESGRSVLLLEDLASLRSVELDGGCSVEDAERVVVAMARFHAAWWEHPEVEAQADAAPVERILRVWHAMFQRSWPGFAERVAALFPELDLPSDVLELGERLARSSGEVFTSLRRPPVTFVHTDVHLGNLAFDPHDDAPVFFDWQTLSVGRGAVDVAYFLTSALAPGTRQREEARLVERYTEELTRHGGTIDREEWRADLACASLWNLLLLPGFVVEGASAQQRDYVRSVLPRVVGALRDREAARFLD